MQYITFFSILTNFSNGNQKLEKLYFFQKNLVDNETKETFHFNYYLEILQNLYFQLNDYILKMDKQLLKELEFKCQPLLKENWEFFFYYQESIIFYA